MTSLFFHAHAAVNTYIMCVEMDVFFCCIRMYTQFSYRTAVRCHEIINLLSIINSSVVLCVSVYICCDNDTWKRKTVVRLI